MCVSPPDTLCEPLGPIGTDVAAGCGISPPRPGRIDPPPPPRPPREAPSPPFAPPAKVLIKPVASFVIPNCKGLLEPPKLLNTDPSRPNSCNTPLTRPEPSCWA